MNHLHEPTSEFLSHLEWQTLTELRRRERFQRPPRRLPRLARAARLAALVLLSLSLGASAVLAVERLQDSRELVILLERNRVRVELAERRVESAREHLEVEELRYEQGVVSQDGVIEAQRRVAGAELERDHLRLDGEELSAGRRAPDRRLSAPLVGPRDFVSEHLRLDEAGGLRLVTLLEVDEQRAEQLAAAGRTPVTELDRARHATAAARASLELLDERLALRADFLLGRLDAGACERRDLVADAQHRRRAMSAEVAHLERELARAEQREAAGLSAAGSAAPLRAELDGLAVELQLVQLELELLD